ncbi:GntR family transcriptional regulator [Candidatus Leptofilum sp.]|uniref:GntR family transcriptional regulator n=1 Tax=Candidatus Leptofilum sp. TaxID=3241576 RepID=UPI003B5CF74C
MSVNPTAHRSLSEQAYELIRQKIVTLALPPSSVVDEGQLQEELNLGRTPIREALKRLELERLVNIIPRRGIFVTPINLTDLQRLYEMRLELECMATKLATTRGTANHWQEMEYVLKQAYPPGNISPEQLIAIDDQCHRIIYKAADNQFLEQTLMALYPLSLRMWNVALDKLGDNKEKVVKHEHIVEHEQIMAALREGAATEAVALMHGHIAAYQQYIENAILGKSAQLLPT